MTHELSTFYKQMLYQHKMKHIPVASNATWSDKSRAVLFMFSCFNSKSSSKISMNSAVYLHISLPLACLHLKFTVIVNIVVQGKALGWGHSQNKGTRMRR
jgi:hypothetical protein